MTQRNVMSKYDKIVLYHNYDDCDIMCKYAAIIPGFEFGFAIFTTDKVSHADASQHSRRISENMVMKEKEFDNFILIQSNPTNRPESQISIIS
jgi:hypothetical protein